MTEVESVPKANLDIGEDESHITSSCKNTIDHVDVDNCTEEKEEDENVSENTSENEKNHHDSAAAPPPPKNPWTRHLKSKGEKGIGL